MTTISERREQLYGKARQEERENVKVTLTKDSVLQEGEYNFQNEKEKKGIWKSSNARDYAVSATFKHKVTLYL